MKTFLSTTAVALVMGTAALADGHTASFADRQFDPAVNLNASELIGMRVYASEASIDDEMEVAAGAETEWDDIGEINEILLTRDGEVQSVIVGVGGFLGIGEKDVAIDMAQLRFVNEEGESDDFFLVVQANAVGVQDAPAYEYQLTTNTLTDEGEEAEAELAEGEAVEGEAVETEMAEGEAMEGEAVETEMAEGEAMEDEAVETEMAEGEATDENAAEMTEMAVAGPMIERDGFEQITADMLTSEELTGAPVFGVNDEEVGEVGKLLIATDGTLDSAVIDVGGFLGLGEHSVAVPMESLTIMRTAEGSDLRVYIDATEESLENQPEYQG